MFTFHAAFRKAFSDINGQVVDVDTIDRHLYELRYENMRNLLPEFNTEWLFEYAERRDWFQYQDKKPGLYKLDIPLHG